MEKREERWLWQGRISGKPPPSSLQVGAEVVSLVVPCADMANHQNIPNAAYAYSAARDAFELTALQVRQSSPYVRCTISSPPSPCYAPQNSQAGITLLCFPDVRC